MTPEQHNKYLAYSHLAYASLFFLMMMFFLLFFGAMMLGVMSADPNGPPLVFMIFIWLFIALIYGGMTVPSFIAGYGLLKKKKWARTAAIISAVVAAMQFPIGTAVCVYTFWFLFSEPGKAMFERSTYALPSGRQSWASEARKHRDVQYQPPPSPPDWR